MTSGNSGDGMVQRDFRLGKPALVCRWRLSNRGLPMANRHLRALGARRIAGQPVSPQLVAWAKQHVEWTLEEGSATHPDGVLMLVVDEAGQAAMTVGPYEELEHPTLGTLVRRATLSLTEARTTRVAPESLWAAEGDILVCGLPQEYRLAGTTSLVLDLARTLGITVRLDEGLVPRLGHGRGRFDEVFLVSDEFGVVPASNVSGERSRRLAAGYQRLLDSRR